jgi:hypothetical protein
VKLLEEFSPGIACGEALPTVIGGSAVARCLRRGIALNLPPLAHDCWQGNIPRGRTHLLGSNPVPRRCRRRVTPAAAANSNPPILSLTGSTGKRSWQWKGNVEPSGLPFIVAARMFWVRLQRTLRSASRLSSPESCGEGKGKA